MPKKCSLTRKLSRFWDPARVSIVTAAVFNLQLCDQMTLTCALQALLLFLLNHILIMPFIAHWKWLKGAANNHIYMQRVNKRTFTYVCRAKAYIVNRNNLQTCIDSPTARSAFYILFSLSLLFFRLMCMCVEALKALGQCVWSGSL